MEQILTIGVVSDIHYASDAEKARGDDYELNAIGNAATRHLLRLFRHFIWLRAPLRHNDLLDRFLEQTRDVDWVVANGDYSCDTAFVGLSDDAALKSARECLEKLRAQFSASILATLGDHELGKLTLAGRNGGMRLASYRRAVDDLRIKPFWQQELGRYRLIGVSSTLLALPILESELLPEEHAEWKKLRSAHLREITAAFSALKNGERVVLFCHDPTALPFLWREEPVRQKLTRVELTVIGHLHSSLIFWKSRLLAGMPQIRFLGHSVRKMSGALREARHWKAFNAQLCPSLAGIELLKDGGFLTLTLDPEARRPLSLRRHRLSR